MSLATTDLAASVVFPILYGTGPVDVIPPDGSFGHHTSAVQTVYRAYTETLEIERLVPSDDPRRAAQDAAKDAWMSIIRMALPDDQPLVQAVSEMLPLDIGGIACCPIHRRPLKRDKFSDDHDPRYRCTARDATTEKGWCAWQWRGPLPEGLKVGTLPPLRLEVAPTEQPLPANDTPTTKPHMQRILTLAQLQRSDLQPPAWVIERIAPVGATLLAAKPKSRKSYMALHLGLAVASGGKALGCLEAQRGDVLYIDLDSRQWRIKARVQQMIGVRTDWPENFHVIDAWSNGDEALNDVRYWLMTHPAARLVVVDV